MTDLSKGDPTWNLRLGQNIKKKRMARGLSQEGLAASMGVSFQQVQKYEKGVNRISAERLWGLCTILNVELSDFFEGIDNPTITPVRADPEMLELAKAYYELSNPLQFLLRKIANLLRTYEAKQPGVEHA